MSQGSVKYFFTQNKIFFYGVANVGGLVVVFGSGLVVVWWR